MNVLAHVSRAALCTAPLLCGLAIAQNYTAFPIDNLTGGTSQNIPWAGGTPNWDEARSQYLFPAAFIPTTGGLITGLELVPEATYATPYERFEIWLDHTTSPTLSATFAANLTNPQLVLKRSPGTIQWSSGTWTQITFDTPFVYDGVRNLVMEVRKKLDRPNNPTITAVSQRVLVYPRRTDVQPPIWDYGIYGSGKVDSTTATSTYSTHFLMRLRWGASRTLTIDSTRDITGNASRAYHHLGATLTLTTQGAASEGFADFLDVGLSPVGISLGPIAGRVWLTPSLLHLYSGVLDAGGRGAAAVTIPNNAALIGLRVFFQSAVGGASVSLTNVVDAPLAAY